MAKKKITTTTTTVTEVITDSKTIYDFFILDRSGSMSSILESTMSGFNEYINKAQRTASEQNIRSIASVLLFDDEFINLHSYTPIADVKPLTRETYVPRGMTALNDAIGKAINSLKTELKGKEASDDVDVTITIFTDGQENSSKEFSGSTIAKLIKDVQDEYKWTVAYVGAGSKEAIQNIAASMNILASNSMNYTANAAGAGQSFTTLTNARSMKSMAFSSAGLKTNEGYLDSGAISSAPTE